jgi:antitoxin PrlF
MIHSRITSKSQTTVPLAIRRALHIETGDDIVWEIEDGRAYVAKAAVPAAGFVADTSMFTEWADELDAAYDVL